MIKSPLRYPGGKSRSAKLITSLAPEFEEYREPFLGGGSVFIYLKQQYPDRKFIVSDIYNPLISFWRECRDNKKRLVKQINTWKLYKNGKELYLYLIDNIDKFNSLKQAAAFFVLNRITFSGTIESGGFSKESFEKRFTQSSVNRVIALSPILNNTLIMNTDYRHIICRYGDNVFMYLDPPYHVQSKLYGKRGKLSSFSHKGLADVLRSSQYKWLLTYNDCEYIRELYSFADIDNWNASYGMSKKNKELFIKNY